MPIIAAAPPPGRVANAIAQASARTGADFDYMLAQARVESNFDPAARAGTSSAAGLYQFTNQTWLETVRRHGAKHGYDWASTAIGTRGGRAFVQDPALRDAVMNLRFDAGAASLMAGELAGDNARYLQNATGQTPDTTALYLAHFLGAGGAARFLSAMASDPRQSAGTLFPEAAAANAGIFRTEGRDRSLGEVHALFAAKLGTAGTGGVVAPRPVYIGTGTPNRSPTPVTPDGAEDRPRASMAQVLASTFAGGGTALGGRAGRHVAAAYASIARAGL